MPKNFDKGIDYYTEGVAEINVYFPEDDIRCVWCPFCRSEADFGRYWCRLTNRMVYSPTCADLPDFCPITIQN